MCSILEILSFLLSILQTIIIVHIIVSWLVSFGVLNLGQPIVASVWDGLQRLLEPMYGPIRRALPPMGGLDLAPLVVILGVFVAQTLIRNNLPAACYGF
ncbi:YggT family protein [Jannaschia sp. W003]|uniref:YggT family protein n=1 Tax=Jannaschia sp. W003 TaxID=2867012 RepID=UPI0021A89791|nr:YggT family protein [Jannaschia sp. W003]UWQ22178.1 YggT family protein [Jannaschia sp. W003]